MATLAGSRPKTPGFAYTAIALAIAILVSVMALTQRQPPPPTIAEFAPQAVEQIKDAPSEQSSEFGSAGGGSGGLGGGGAGPGFSVLQPPPIQVPRVRRCIGDPPRQIEDPQSPPCVPYWEGNNGGATSKGVTRDEIRIAAPWIESGPAQGAPGMTQGMNDLVNFFNKRFEFYGRKINVLRHIGPGPDENVVNVQQMQADAIAVDGQNVFASTPYSDHGGNEYHYMDELARRGIISTSSARGLLTDEDHYTSFQPHEWNVHPGVRVIGQNLGEFVCKQLAGGTSVYARGAEANKPRKFGLLRLVSPDGSVPDTSPMVNELSRCGVTPVQVDVSYDAGDQAGKQNAMIAFRTQDVTTVITWSFAATLALQIYPAAESQSFFPEWVLSSYGGQMEEGACLVSPAKGQCDQAFGVDFRNKDLAQADIPITWAMTEVDPGYEEEQSEAHERYMYWPLLLLSSGIQMAGPNLNPTTFQQGLFKTRFPNPGCTGPPYYQACVGFGVGDHTFLNDATIKWYSSSERSMRTNLAAAFCYADHGRRYSFGKWPTEKRPLFQAPCY